MEVMKTLQAVLNDNDDAYDVGRKIATGAYNVMVAINPKRGDKDFAFLVAGFAIEVADCFAVQVVRQFPHMTREEVRANLVRGFEEAVRLGAEALEKDPAMKKAARS